MARARPRIPEGGAIRDESSMSAEAYGELMRSKLEGEYRRFAEAALAFGSPPEGGRVLEIGPGPGWAGIMLLERRSDLALEGIDASPDMVRAATANAAREGMGARARYRSGYAECLEGVADRSVDLAISRDSLHHWQDPRAAFASILRALKPQGCLYLSDERRDLSIPAWALVYTLGFLAMGGFSKYWRSSIRAGYTAGELRTMLPAEGTRATEVEAGFLELTVRIGPVMSRTHQ